jgi:signal peptidase I
MMIVLLTVIAIITGLIWVLDYTVFRKQRLQQSETKTPGYLVVVETVFPLSVIAVLLLKVNFEWLLTLATLASAVIYFLDVFWLKKRRASKNISERSIIVEYGRSFFPVLLAVLVIRSFIVQPVRVPTGSLEPTVMPIEFIVVKQYSYGLRLPALHTKVVSIGEPKIGDIVVFRWPVNPSIDFVKRVIGTPGDYIEYKNKVLYINGKEAKQTFVGPALDIEPESQGGDIPVKKYSENLNGVVHDILINPRGGDDTDFSITVPEGMYFMMGDNRDDSDDSRSWGFVPEANLRGKAVMVWLSWDKKNHRIRWNRIGEAL